MVHDFRYKLARDGMRKDLCGRRSSHVATKILVNSSKGAARQWLLMSAFVGLDVHFEKTFATVLDQDGRVVAQRRMMNEHVPDFLKLFNVERGWFGSFNVCCAFV